MTVSEKLTFLLTGMDCPDSVVVIENAVDGLPGVAYVGVSLSGGTMTVRSDDGFDASALASKLQALGYGIGGANPASLAAKVCRCRRVHHPES